MLKEESISDFYVWTDKDYNSARAFPDTEFWIFLKNLFILCLLPELTGKSYSSRKTALDCVDDTVNNNSNNDKSDRQILYCYCQGEEFGEMIACDSSMSSIIEWFYVKCLH